MKRIGGMRRKSRYKMKKKDKGKINLTRYFQTFKAGDKVILVADSSIQKGTYCLRFHGKSGEIKGTKGKCYIVKIKDQKKVKEVIVHPVHLKRG